MKCVIGTHADLSEDPADVIVCVTGVELSKQQFSCQTLGGKTGHSAAIIAIKNPIEETAILASDWWREKKNKQTCSFSYSLIREDRRDSINKTW